MTDLILTEKPSVARAIAQTLGTVSRKEGYLESGGYVITWAVGHLLSLAPPEDYNQEWKSWKLETLPMIPASFRLVINQQTGKQFQTVKEWLTNPDIENVIFATDAGPEGELIARWIYQKTNCRKPVKRLWISSLTEEAIRTGMQQLRPASDFDRLFQAAASRARSDWLVGMNATRAITCSLQTKDYQNTVFSVWRVQTPTLRKVVERDREIREFVPETYYEVMADFEAQDGVCYQGRYFDIARQTGRINNEKHARNIVSETQGKTTENVQMDLEKETVHPPSLFSLSTLQQQASRRFNLTVAKVSELAQELYEQGWITYPRTADHLVTPDVAAIFPEILDALREQGYAEVIPTTVPVLTYNTRYVGEVTDHHAIIPTGKLANPDGEATKIYDLIVRTFIAAHHPPGIDEKIRILTTVDSNLFLTNEKLIVDPGWRQVFGVKIKDTLLRRLKTPVHVLNVDYLEQKTSPPAHYTESALIKEMERCRLGTPATRAGILERLKQQKYVFPEGRVLLATEKAETLLNELGNSLLASVEMTAQWEEKLEEIRDGKIDIAEFNQEIDRFVISFVQERKDADSKNQVDHAIGICPICKYGQVVKKEKESRIFYGCSRYKDGCSFFVSGEIAGQLITEADILRLLQHGRTKTKVFLFKNRKTNACLALRPDGSTYFDFETDLLSRIKKMILRG